MQPVLSEHALAGEGTPPLRTALRWPARCVRKHTSLRVRPRVIRGAERATERLLDLASLFRLVSTLTSRKNIMMGPQLLCVKKARLDASDTQEAAWARGHICGKERRAKHTISL